MESAWAIRNAMVTGMVGGAADFFGENAAALAVLVYDVGLGGALDNGLGIGGSAERNQARIDAVLYVIHNPGEVPTAILNQLKADMAEAGRLFEAGDLDGAARIMGRMEAGIASGMAGAAGAVQLTASGARALAKITRKPVVYRELQGGGAAVTNTDLPDGFRRVAHPNGDIVTMATDARVFASVDEIGVGNWMTYRIGGPGVWAHENVNMKDAERAYQQRVTGAPDGTAYNVADPNDPSGVTSFDGCNPQTNTLIDAKCWTCWPDNSLSYSNRSVVDQAFRQQRRRILTNI